MHHTLVDPYPGRCCCHRAEAPRYHSSSRCLRLAGHRGNCRFEPPPEITTSAGPISYAPQPTQWVEPPDSSTSPPLPVIDMLGAVQAGRTMPAPHADVTLDEVTSELRRLLAAYHARVDERDALRRFAGAIMAHHTGTIEGDDIQLHACREGLMTCDTVLQRHACGRCVAPCSCDGEDEDLCYLPLIDAYGNLIEEVGE